MYWYGRDWLERSSEEIFYFIDNVEAAGIQLRTIATFLTSYSSTASVLRAQTAEHNPEIWSIVKRKF